MFVQLGALEFIRENNDEVATKQLWVHRIHAVMRGHFYIACLGDTAKRELDYILVKVRMSC